AQRAAPAVLPRRPRQARGAGGGVGAVPAPDVDAGRGRSDPRRPARPRPVGHVPPAGDRPPGAPRPARRRGPGPPGLDPLGVLAALTAAIAYAALAHVHEYAEGAAVVQFTGRSELIAHEPGTIASLDAVRGQRVEQGQVLARLHDAEQVGQLKALDTEFESKLVAYLQSPSDAAVKQALGAIRS